MNHIPYWASYFNITEEISLQEALKNQIPENDYLRWASLHYQIPCFSKEFFNLQPPLKLWNKVQHWTDVWNPALVPVREWNNILYVGCLEPLNSLHIKNHKIVFILAPVQQLENLWKSLNPNVKKEKPLHKNTPLNNSQTPAKNKILLSPDQDPPVLKIRNEDQPSHIKNTFEQKTAHKPQKTSQQETLKPSPNQSQTSHSIQKQNNDDFIIEDEPIVQKSIVKTSFSLLRTGLNIFTHNPQKSHTITSSKSQLSQQKKQTEKELNNSPSTENKTTELTANLKNTKTHSSSFILTQNTNPLIESSNLPPSEQTQPPKKINKKTELSQIRIKLEHTKKYAKSYILFVFKDKYFIPWKWSFDLKPKNKTFISIKYPSLFRIAYHSKKPYFGYVPPVAGNHDFFDQWNLPLPEQLVFIPFINSNNNTLLGGYLGLLNKDQSSLEFLNTIVTAVQPLQKFYEEESPTKKGA